MGSATADVQTRSRRHRSLLLMLLVLPLGLHAAELKLMTYNVFFDDQTGQLRYPQIMAHIRTRDPDVVALQEVTPAFHALLKESDLARMYTISPGEREGRYFTLLLSKGAPVSVGRLAFESRMGRDALYVDLLHEGTPVRVVTVHLESSNDERSRALRQQQVARLSELLKGHTVIVGDFNYPPKSPFYERAPHELIDAAVAAGGTEQVTFDTLHNPLATETPGVGTARPGGRIDRVYHTSALSTTHYRVERVFYSDHYPVLVTLAVPNAAAIGL